MNINDISAVLKDLSPVRGEYYELEVMLEISVDLDGNVRVVMRLFSFSRRVGGGTVCGV